MEEIYKKETEIFSETSPTFKENNLHCNFFF